MLCYVMPKKENFSGSSNYAPQLYRQVLLWRVLAMAILSVCLSVCLSGVSRSGAEPSPGEIETPDLHQNAIIAKTPDKMLLIIINGERDKKNHLVYLVCLQTG